MWALLRKKPNKKGEEGFTLIELIVVIAILGFLMAIAIPRYTTARITAAQNATQANLKNLANSIELYATEFPTEKYPTNSEINSWIGKYIVKAPKTPTKNAYYQYNQLGEGNSFAIYDPNVVGDKVYWVGPNGIIENASDQSSDPTLTGYVNINVGWE